MLERIKEYYSSNLNAKHSVLSEIKEGKAISFLIDNAVITEISAEQLKTA
jgi:trigger factor